MNGELVVAATLAAVGGRWLRDGGTMPDLRGHSSFRQVGRFTADLPAQGPLGRSGVTSTPEEWLRALQELGTSDLSLVTQVPAGVELPAHLAAAFANSRGWALLATGRGASSIWTFRWKVVPREAPDAGIWSVAAVSAPAEELSPPRVGVAEARARLSAALAAIHAFAVRTDLRGWASQFAIAAARLDDPPPAPAYRRDLLPADAAPARRQLVAAIFRGWVFGGMGSWNDVGLADPAAGAEYERLSAELYAALLVALPAATNGA
ncbi:hypothetical protein [Nocardioides pantholopis]|uniref:hypothetical protein n=1 Tax=Nocardioides pantholopis TaxID=2483798 RepID=UPI0019D1D8BD|nr:hypothetical protein [Nocardioides pantholopis]